MKTFENQNFVLKSYFGVHLINLIKKSFFFCRHIARRHFVGNIFGGEVSRVGISFFDVLLPTHFNWLKPVLPLHLNRRSSLQPVLPSFAG